VKEFESLAAVNAEILVPWFNLFGPRKTGFKGSLFPLALTKEQVHALYWRVKSIELDFVVTYPYSGGGVFTYSAESLAEVGEGGLVNNIETVIRQRVCGGFNAVSYLESMQRPNEAKGFYTNELYLFSGEYVSFGVPRCLKVGNTYYPYLAWRTGGDVTTFGVEYGYPGLGDSVETYLSGPTVTLNFPDSSTATFKTWRYQITTTFPATYTATMTTSGNWAVSLW
jgi:hypothetical protein